MIGSFEVRATLVAAVMAAVGCGGTKAAGDRRPTVAGEPRERELGQRASDQVVAFFGVYGDDHLNRYVAAVGYKLVAVSERKDLPWTFRVLDDASVNAFALPGGSVFVTRGLLAHLENEAQLAAVLGHQMGHVMSRHATRALAAGANPHVGPQLTLFATTARKLGQAGMRDLPMLFLSFGVDDEREADASAFVYTHRAGYDPHEVPKAFEALGRVDGAAGGRLLPWKATHLDSPERVSAAQARLAALAPAERAGSVGGKLYLDNIDGLVFGANPRDGHFRGAKFVHPDAQFSLDLPQGWPRQSLRRMVVAVSPRHDALVQLTVAPKHVGAEDAMSAFFAKRGRRQLAPARKVDGSGLGAQFVAVTKDGEMGGFVAFFAHGNATYQLIAATDAAGLSRHAPAFEQVVNSFRRIEDPRMLSVQPVRLRIDLAGREAPLGVLASEQPSSVSIDELARINQMAPATVVPHGHTLKWAVGGMPQSVDVGMR